MSRQSTEAHLEGLREALEELEEIRDKFSLDTDDYEDQFNEFLDEQYPEFFGHPPSAVLKEGDPTQYSEELSNYVDGLDVEDDKEYKNLLDEIEALEYEIELAEELLENLEDDDDDD